RIFPTRFRRSVRHYRSRCGLRSSDRFFVIRNAESRTDVASNPFSVPNIYRNESPDVPALRCTRRNTFLSSDEFDPDSALSGNRSRGGVVAVYPARVRTFPLVRRIGLAIRTASSVNCRTVGRSVRLCAFLATWNWQQLLDGFLSTSRGPRFGNGH